ncbi:MAG TPA: hypothetical protein VJA21_30985 [Verrucomicrobiae bacterium]
MRPKLNAVGWAGLMVCLLAFAGEGQAQAAVLKLEAQLVWGTDDSKPPAGKNYQPVQPELKKKLKDLPLKWSNYFEVNRKSLEVKAGETRKEPMSDKCEILVKHLDNSDLEVSLIGKGKEVMKRRQSLPRGEILVLGGNAPNATAWLVILRQAE